MSTFYEGDTENDYDAESTTVETASQPLEQPTPVFTTSNVEVKKAEKKSKSKNKYNVGGTRIVTLNYFSSSEDDDDESSGQVSRKYIYNYLMNIILTQLLVLTQFLGILCRRFRTLWAASLRAATKESFEGFCFGNIQIGERERC